MDWNGICRVFEDNKDNPPENEEATRFRVIDLILDALEYSRMEVYPNRSDGSGGIPDYTILPNHEKEFFLEAKAWNVPLREDFIRQATNYAYQRGHRWVVLTNGCHWQLFDSYIQGKSSNRLVLSYEFHGAKSDAPPPLIFQAICRESVISGRTDEYALSSRLRELIKKELKEPNSSIIASMQRNIRRRDGFGKVTREMIVSCLTDQTPCSGSRSIPDSVNEIIKTRNSNPSCKTLAELENDPPKGDKPVSVCFPDGGAEAVRSWKDITMAILNWLASNNRIPAIPYSSASGKSYFLNTSPNHQKARMRSPREFQYNGQAIYVEAHGSASYLVSKTLEICRQVGFTGDEFNIEIRF